MKDILGMIVSGVCICHCLFTPILLNLMLIGTTADLLVFEYFHFMVLGLATILGIYSFSFSYKKHYSLVPSILGVAGLILLFTAIYQSSFWETLLTLVGGLLLILAHWKNKTLQYYFI
ncbi:MerC domain-containing protein [Aliikangiella sp. IMCC44359]|uniref:MerC domain-containing protein n=1 Tax=Aliikangiella sp. IMCC44359 TaxID=3459125 RepID=UPI00403ABBB6